VSPVRFRPQPPLFNAVPVSLSSQLSAGAAVQIIRLRTVACRCRVSGVAGQTRNKVSQPDQVFDMAEAQSGEAEAAPPEFNSTEAVFLALEAPLLAYALRLLKEPAMAQDVVQESFVRLHAEFESVRDPRRWLYRTVHNLALNQLRRDSKVVPLRPPSETSEGATTFDVTDPQLLPDEEIIRIESIGLVRLSLRALDERSRELVRLKFNEGLSYKEIGARTGLTTSNVGYLLHHALKAIEAELTKSGGIR
jgi:RNA polymerase sigma factor (sigma-70 family)